MSGYLVPNGKAGYVDSNGRPLSNGTVSFYAVGTQTPKDTWQDVGLTILNTNPIVLDARGQASIYGSGDYRQILKTYDGTLIWDQVVPDLTTAIQETVDDLVGQSQIQVDSVAALRLVDKTQYRFAHTTGYYGKGTAGDGDYYYDSADISSLDNGGTIIVADDGGRWKLLFNGGVSVLQFGVKADAGATDNSVRLQACRDWAASDAVRNQLYFPAGIYGYSISPNWGIDGITVRFEGEVRFRYSGTGNAVIIDAGASPAKISNAYFGDGSCPIIEAPDSAGHGMYVRGLIRGELQGRCYGAGSTSAGLRMEGCVLVLASFITTNDEGGAFYLDAKPKYGISLSESAVGAQTAYCTFLNCNVQSCEVGLLLDSTLGNVFIGGDYESNTLYGMQLTPLAFNNKFYGADFEVNTTADVICAGSYNEFSIDTSGTGAGGFRFVGGSVGNRLIGGEHDLVAIDAGLGNYIGGIVYGRGLSGNLQIIDNGAKSAFGKNWQAQQQRWTFGPTVQTSITVGASPFTYTNNSGMAQNVITTGGTVSGIVQAHGAIVLGNVAVNGVARLEVGDQLTVTYTVLPTMSSLTI